MTGTHRVLAVAVSLLLVLVWGTSLAQAKIETFHFAYAGVGQFANKSQVDDDAGCRREADWSGKYAFRQDWTVKASVRPHLFALYKNAEYLGSHDLAGYPTSLDVTGTQVAQPGLECQWAGGPNDTGRFQCGDDHAKLLYDDVLRLTHVAATKTNIFTAPAFVFYDTTMTGTSTIPSLKPSGCQAIANSAGLYAPGFDIAVRIPIKSATLYHLKLGHYFKVRTSLGHYTVAPDQTGKSCFSVTKGPHDFCTVERDTYRGEIAVKRTS